VCLQEHEVLRWHHSAGRVHLHGVENVDAELKVHVLGITDRSEPVNVRKQRHVTVRTFSAVGKCLIVSIYLPNINSASIKSQGVKSGKKTVSNKSLRNEKVTQILKVSWTAIKTNVWVMIISGKMKH